MCIMVIEAEFNMKALLAIWLCILYHVKNRKTPKAYVVGL